MEIGDKVKILVHNPKKFSAGTIGTIVNYRSIYDNPYKVSANGQSWWYKSEHLEAVK